MMIITANHLVYFYPRHTVLCRHSEKREKKNKIFGKKRGETEKTNGFIGNHLTTIFFLWKKKKTRKMKRKTSQHTTHNMQSVRLHNPVAERKKYSFQLCSCGKSNKMCVLLFWICVQRAKIHCYYIVCAYFMCVCVWNILRTPD